MQFGIWMNLLKNYYKMKIYLEQHFLEYKRDGYQKIQVIYKLEKVYQMMNYKNKKFNKNNNKIIKKEVEVEVIVEVIVEIIVEVIVKENINIKNIMID